MHDFVPPNVRDLIIQSVAIVFSREMSRSGAERALMILTLLSPNNISYSEFGLVNDINFLKINFSLPLSSKKFNRIVEVMKDSGIEITNWQKA